MSESLAAEYADEMAARFREWDESGTPFGIVEDPDYCERCYGKDETCSHADDAYDYLRDVLDIEYRVGSGGEYRSAKILLAFGGPNMWLDTSSGQIIVTWWSAPEYRWLPEETCKMLDDTLSELWESR